MAKKKVQPKHLSTIQEVDDYFSSQLIETDESISLLNDYYLTFYFLKMLAATRGSVNSGNCVCGSAYYGYGRQNYPFGHRKFNKTDRLGCVYISYSGGEIEVGKDQTANACIYIRASKQRRSMKITDTSVVINLEWLRPLIKKNIVKVEEEKNEKKALAFQKELIVPWMHQMILDSTGIETKNIVANRSELIIENFDRNAYWSKVYISLDKADAPIAEFEDSIWRMNIKCKVHIADLKFESVIAILKAFKESGKFK